MAYRVNRTHFVYFRSVTGLHLSNFVVTFLADSVACSTAITLAEIQTGLYACTYTPLTPAFYYLELVNSANSIHVIDTVEIDSTDTFFGQDSTVLLTQNYGSNGRFAIPTTEPSNTRILIFNSTDWISGNTSSSYLVNSTAVDSAGNWLTPTLPVNHGTYHIVQSIAFSTTKVLAAFLVV